jgi:hypothetical protein
VVTYQLPLPRTEIEACSSAPGHGPVTFHHVEEGSIPMTFFVFLVVLQARCHTHLPMTMRGSTV